MPLIDFQDAVTAANLDPNQTHAVYYYDGRFANRTAVAARCPRAKLFGITVFGATGPDVFACDSETGDLTVDQTVVWVQKQVALGVKLICVYANLNRWLNEGLKAALDKYGSRIKRWVADYDNVRHIQPWADAEQWADPGPIDRNVALANFFDDLPPRPHYDWYDATRRLLLCGQTEAGLVREYDRLRAMQRPTRHPNVVRLNLVRVFLRLAAGRVFNVGRKTATRPASWDVDHRGWRCQQLIHRAQGQRVV